MLAAEVTGYNVVEICEVCFAVLRIGIVRHGRSGCRFVESSREESQKDCLAYFAAEDTGAVEIDIVAEAHLANS